MRDFSATEQKMVWKPWEGLTKLQFLSQVWSNYFWQLHKTKLNHVKELPSQKSFFAESPCIEDFGHEVGMTKQEVDNLRLILVSVEQGDIGILHSLGIMVEFWNICENEDIPVIKPVVDVSLRTSRIGGKHYNVLWLGTLVHNWCLNLMEDFIAPNIKMDQTLWHSFWYILSLLRYMI